MTTMTNGRVRKNLASQLDRLDLILDGLSDGLNEAVVSVVKEAVTAAVQEAVRGVLAELLTTPNFLQAVRGTVNPSNPANAQPKGKISGWQKLKRLALLAGLAKAWVINQLEKVRHMQPVAKRKAGQVIAKVRQHWQLVRRFKGRLLIALGAGACLSCTAYCLSPWLGALVSGLASFYVALLVQAKMALRRLAGIGQG